MVVVFSEVLGDARCCEWENVIRHRSYWVIWFLTSTACWIFLLGIGDTELAWEVKSVSNFNSSFRAMYDTVYIEQEGIRYIVRVATFETWSWSDTSFDLNDYIVLSYRYVCTNSNVHMRTVKKDVIHLSTKMIKTMMKTVSYDET